MASMLIKLPQLPTAERYRWMTRVVVPRPVAWTLTENDGGSLNLAPFSYFNALSTSPPLIGVSFSPPTGRLSSNKGAKDTLANIRKKRRFVVHIAPMSLLQELNKSAATLPYDESELSLICLPTEEFGDFPTPRIVGCPVAMACELHREINISDNNQVPQILVLGKVQLLFIDEKVLTTDEKGRQTVNTEAMDPVARLADGHYAGLSKLTRLKRPA